MYAFAPSRWRRCTSATRTGRGRTGCRARRCCPAGFAAANLIIYWGGFDGIWKLLAAIFLGRVLFEFALRHADDGRARHRLARHLVDLAVAHRHDGHRCAGPLRHGHNVLPDWIDLVVVIVFSLAIFYYAVEFAMTKEQVRQAIESEDWSLTAGDDIRVAG